MFSESYSPCILVAACQAVFYFIFFLKVSPYGGATSEDLKKISGVVSFFVLFYFLSIFGGVVAGRDLECSSVGPKERVAKTLSYGDLCRFYELIIGKYWENKSNFIPGVFYIYVLLCADETSQKFLGICYPSFVREVLEFRGKGWVFSGKISCGSDKWPGLKPLERLGLVPIRSPRSPPISVGVVPCPKRIELLAKIYSRMTPSPITLKFNPGVLDGNMATAFFKFKSCDWNVTYSGLKTIPF